MQYWIILNRKKKDESYHHHDSYLPGIRVPKRVESMLTLKWVDENFPEWCGHCELACHCHPIMPDGSKYCTVLLHDAVKPDWKIEDIC